MVKARGDVDKFSQIAEKLQEGIGVEPSRFGIIDEEVLKAMIAGLPGNLNREQRY